MPLLDIESFLSTQNPWTLPPCCKNSNKNAEEEVWGMPLRDKSLLCRCEHLRSQERHAVPELLAILQATHTGRPQMWGFKKPLCTHQEAVQVARAS